MLDLKTLLKTPQVDPLFEISPDSSKLAFSWNKTGVWQIYEMDLNDPANVEILTSGSGGKFNPRYSPDGTQIAYAFDADGSESYHIYLYNRSEKKHTDLTPDIDFAVQPNFTWSPDGNQLAYLSDQSGHFCAYRISTLGGYAKLILDTGHPAWKIEWSPTGTHIAVCCEMHGQDYGIFIIDLNNNGVSELPLDAHDPHWTKDGTKLYFHASRNGWFNIGLYDIDTKHISWLTESTGDSQAPVVIAETIDSQSFAHIQSKGTLNWIEIRNLDGKEMIQIEKGFHEGIVFTSDGKRMICSFSNPKRPRDLWMIELESGKSIQLTNSILKEFQSTEFTMPEEIQYEGIDGIEIPALLFKIEKSQSAAIVMIHGGPNWHFSMEWNPLMAYLASCGYILLCPNYRGSTGYGRDWQYAAQFDYGGIDTRDVAAGAQYLMREGLASKIAVTGRSHGGYLTMTCLTQFPDLWCAGSAVVPFVNWFKSHEDSRDDLKHWNIETMGNPVENYDRWYNASPFFFLDRINAPVQMICGGYDPRCPASDSIEARDRLMELGKEIDFLLYEDEGHTFLKIENVIDAEVKRMDFLEKALANTGAKWNP